MPFMAGKGHLQSATADTATPLFAPPGQDWRGDLHPAAQLEAMPSPDGSRFIALDAEAEPQFLRAEKRVPVRRAAVTRKTATRLRLFSMAAAGVLLATLVAGTVYRYLTTAARFRLDSGIAVSSPAGAQNISRAQVLEVFARDIGHNVFLIPLGERKRQVERIPWVRSAAVMRLLPNQFRIALEERAPIAFAEIGSRILLVDADGVLLDPPGSRAARYSFPVIVGMGEAEPVSTRAARMKIYAGLVHDLDSGGARYSAALSEVDLGDPEDVKVTVPNEDGAVLVHLGDTSFQERFRTYESHVQLWRQQYHRLESVDLRFDRQVIVHPVIASAPEPGPHG
ncbi:MAG: FtsQ-type POTRA domain-containing protein, partial [Acidobacteria bacterium]|nr:FtsQ-type POTRA domain-containing protein [Acidobacteriota bacterium]